MHKLMPIPHVLHMKEIIPMGRSTNNCGGDMFTGGPMYATAIPATLTMAESHIKTDSIKLQLQAECWYEQDELPQA